MDIVYDIPDQRALIMLVTNHEYVAQQLSQCNFSDQHQDSFHKDNDKSSLSDPQHLTDTGDCIHHCYSRKDWNLIRTSHINAIVKYLCILCC